MRAIDSTTFLAPLTFLGSDFEIEIEIDVYSYATEESGLYGPPEHYDPGESADFTPVSITLREDRIGHYGPDFLATGALFDTLADYFEEECRAAADSLSPSEYDEDYYRGER